MSLMGTIHRAMVLEMFFKQSGGVMIPVIQERVDSLTVSSLDQMRAPLRLLLDDFEKEQKGAGGCSDRRAMLQSEAARAVSAELGVPVEVVSDLLGEYSSVQAVMRPVALAYIAKRSREVRC